MPTAEEYQHRAEECRLIAEQVQDAISAEPY
jgi:hypothetical protein